MLEPRASEEISNLLTSVATISIRVQCELRPILGLRVIFSRVSIPFRMFSRQYIRKVIKPSVKHLRIAELILTPKRFDRFFGREIFSLNPNAQDSA